MFDKLLDLILKLYSWTWEAAWRTWLAHGVEAAFLMLPAVLLWAFGLVDVRSWSACAIMGFFVLREVEGVLMNLLGRSKVDWLDHTMDAVTPVAVAFTLAVL